MASNTILAKMAFQISANTAEFNKALQQSNNSLKSFQRGFSNIASSLGVGLGLAAVVSGFREMIAVASRFEYTMSTVKAITGATASEFKSLRNDALQLGRSTKFTADEVGQLQVNYGRLGFTTQEILKATKATLSLAAATGEDLAKSADVAGSTIRGFGLDASETQRVVDVMASSFNKTALGLENFTESMKYVAPVANAAGASVEETTALLGVLADAGIRGSMAGTSLRKIFTDMTKDGRPLSERLDELAKKGITLSDSMDEVGRTAQTSLLILSKNREKTNALASAFNNASGEAERVSKIMEDNLQGDVTKLTSAWEGLILAIQKTSLLRGAVQGLTSLVNGLNPNAQSADVFAQALKNLNFELNYYREQGATKDNNPAVFELLGQKVERVKELANELGIRLVRLKDNATGVEKFIIDTRTLAKAEEDIVNVQDRKNSALEEELRIKNALADIDRRLKGRGQAPPGIYGNIFGTTIDTTSIEAAFKRLNERMAQTAKGSATVTTQVSQDFVEMGALVGGSVAGIAESLGQAFVDSKDFGRDMLKVVANFASQLGQALIAIGTGLLVARKAITKPGLAIAAGVALVALAGALSASVSKAQSNFNRGSSSSSSEGVSRAGGVITSDLGDRIVLSGDFRVSGNDLVAVITNQNRVDSRTKFG